MIHICSSIYVVLALTQKKALCLPLLWAFFFYFEAKHSQFLSSFADDQLNWTHNRRFNGDIITSLTTTMHNNKLFISFLTLYISVNVYGQRRTNASDGIINDSMPLEGPPQPPPRTTIFRQNQGFVSDREREDLSIGGRPYDNRFGPGFVQNPMMADYVPAYGQPYQGAYPFGALCLNILAIGKENSFRHKRPPSGARSVRQLGQQRLEQLPKRLFEPGADW